MHHNQMHQNGCFPESKQMKKEGIHVQMDGARDVPEVDIRFLSDKDPPTGV